MKVVIALGLPGSGKSTLIRKLRRQEKPYMRQPLLIHEDSHYHPSEAMGALASQWQWEKEAVYFDLLIRDQNSLRRLIGKIEEVNREKGFNYDLNYEIHLFDNNPEAAIINDRVRGRSVDAIATINGMSKAWSFNPEEIKEMTTFPVEVINQKTYAHEGLAQEVRAELGFEVNDKYIYSMFYLDNGSTMWTALDIEEPRALIEILRWKLGENISMSQYLSAKSASCSIEGMVEHDYYDSQTQYGRHVLDIKALENWFENNIK